MHARFGNPCTPIPSSPHHIRNRQYIFFLHIHACAAHMSFAQYVCRRYVCTIQQTGWRVGRQASTQAGRQAEAGRGRQAGGRAGRRVGRQRLAGRQAGKQAGRLAGRQGLAGGQAGKQAGRLAGWQGGSQTGRRVAIGGFSIQLETHKLKSMNYSFIHMHIICESYARA